MTYSSFLFIFAAVNCKPYNETTMKRLLFSAILACLAITMAAQETISVKYQGAKPTISDFATAYLSAYEWNEEEDVLDEARNGMKYVWNKHLKGEPLGEDETLVVDQKNGYVCYEQKDGIYLVKIEMCYWNESDGKHKLFAYNVRCFANGAYSPGQFDGICFLRYTNATKKMTDIDAPGFIEKYDTDDGAYITYSLPRTGKDITYTEWYNDKKRKQKTLKWNGRKFSF